MTRRIPQLDLSHYTRGTPQERDTFIHAWGDGLKEFGFVSIINHGVDSDLIARTYADAARLFALQSEVKQQYEVPGGGGQRGYTSFGKEHAKNRKVGDLKEFWHVGRELPAGSAKKSVYGDNPFPVELPTFKENSLALYRALDATAAVMLRALADSFKLPTETFADMAQEGNSILRIIHYPPLKDMFVPGGVRAAEHEDINLITLLCESTSSGLEILTRQGEWLTVDALKGQIVVDSGDMLSRITNEVIPSTTHRVVNPVSTADDVVRYSMPFFVHPFPDCMLKIFDQCVTPENPKRYPDITADAFLQQRLREIGLIK
ncbi:MAG: 2-oxoglutarate and iron-dependent oxygenase domain-containing protein [Archangium sp.]|nr:2-oxoglutarate and iron-dependent oxygenase domain-containing protein [Archangium sp.]MDP3570684.1 2-oxoglutarate and iron-dependent oxygenase domain-containing protein [Archangium sp.]